MDDDVEERSDHNTKHATNTNDSDHGEVRLSHKGGPEVEIVIAR